MTSVAGHSATRTFVRAGAAALSMALIACGTTDKSADTTAIAPNPAAMPTSDSAMGAQASGSMSGMDHNMASMTGDADRDFLRMMSDHHKGLIIMAHMTKDRKEGGSAVADARKLDAVQDEELDVMVTMLEKDYKDAYAPKVMPEDQAMADALKLKVGKEYDRTFYQNIITHHQGALKMIDEYLPKAKNATLKQMAAKMKTDQTAEMAAFQRKIDQLR